MVYSAGKTPLSYLPLGELVSGSVMGGLIPLASYQALTGMLDARVLLWAVPTIIGVGLIMFTNNTCDLEKDGEAGRHTLSVMLGRKRSLTLYHALVYVWIVAIVVLVAVFFPEGLKNPLVPSTRLAAMPQVLNVNIALGTFYAAAVFASPVLMLIL